jgi:hypothetical protein
MRSTTHKYTRITDILTPQHNDFSCTILIHITGILVLFNMQYLVDYVGYIWLLRCGVVRGHGMIISQFTLGSSKVRSLSAQAAMSLAKSNHLYQSLESEIFGSHCFSDLTM